MPDSDSMRKEVAAAESLAAKLGDAGTVIVFTGAGISTESGIPDFRSPGGIWSRYKPVYFDDFISSEEARRESWRRKFATEETFASAEPNRGHRAVARLVADGVCPLVVTQNVDGLHQAAGVPEDKVIELHGNSTYAGCLDCGARYELGPIREAFRRDETLPVCDACGGMVKTATISFGQRMPEEKMAHAQAASASCDLFLAVGSSLVVQPAAGLPIIAQQSGAKLIILNREETPLDAYADMVLHHEIGSVLGGAVGVN